MKRRLLVAAAVIAVSLAGCGGPDVLGREATPTKEIKQLPPELLPSEVMGLAVTREDMAGPLAGARRAYIDSVGLYSFRKGELLQATLQVTHLNDEAKMDADFRRSLVSQIGGSVPKPVRIGDDVVYLARGTKQSLSVWFRGRNLLVLAVREDFDRPRALLREALELKVEGA